jgi:hypothetical protein
MSRWGRVAGSWYTFLLLLLFTLCAVAPKPPPTPVMHARLLPVTGKSRSTTFAHELWYRELCNKWGVPPGDVRQVNPHSNWGGEIKSSIFGWIEDHRDARFLCLLTHGINGGVGVEHYVNARDAEQRLQDLLRREEFEEGDIEVANVPEETPTWWMVQLTKKGAGRLLPKLNRNSIVILGWCNSDQVADVYASKGAGCILYSEEPFVHTDQITEALKELTKRCTGSAWTPCDSCQVCSLAANISLDVRLRDKCP